MLRASIFHSRINSVFLIINKPLNHSSNLVKGSSQSWFPSSPTKICNQSSSSSEKASSSASTTVTQISSNPFLTPHHQGAPLTSVDVNDTFLSSFFQCISVSPCTASAWPCFSCTHQCAGPISHPDAFP